MSPGVLPEVTLGGVAPKPPAVSACGSMKCRSAIRYVHRVGGGEVPLDMTLEPGGLWVPVLHQGVRCVRERRLTDYAAPGFVEHWSSCPDPAFWQARRRKADPTGVSRAPTAGGVEQGPCAGCRRPDHIAYGRNCKGLLCAGCAAVLAAWRADRDRGPLVYPRWPDRLT